MSRAVVAVVGNPNAGKTTLFNSLTGLRQKVGNYPGVTVERTSGTATLGGQDVEFVDVPGLYSLAPASEDERVAADALIGRNGPKPDLIVCVIDASRLERNLFLFTQVAELGMPTLVVLTMADRVESHGKRLDRARLQDLLGVDAIPVVAHKDRGLDELRAAIADNLAHPKVPMLSLALDPETEVRVGELRERLARMGADYTLAEVRQRLLNPGEEWTHALQALPAQAQAFAEARTATANIRPADDAAARYRWAADVERQSIRSETPSRPRRSRTDRIDALLTHRVFGLIIFVGIMYLVFQAIYTLAAPLMDGIDTGFGWLKEQVSTSLSGQPMAQSFVVDGLIGGVGSVLVFLPQILILFGLIAVLEGSGYLARAAFLMDRLLGWCGLNGRAFIPLLSSYACAIPGIMAARVMPDSRSRLATILVAPLMSCSARLPVYVLLIGCFIEPQFGAFWAGFTLFAMHLLGLLVAIPIAAFFNRRIIRGKRLPFLLELPAYQWPRWKDVLLAMGSRAKVFLKTAGTIIVVMSVAIWALSSFPRLTESQEATIRAAAPEGRADQLVAERQLEGSVLGRFGRAIEPAFVPAGFDWRITTSILAAFPARETVVPSLGIIFSLGGDVDEGSTDLRETLQKATWPDGRPLFTPWVAVGLMVFFALCAQCMATLATVKRETNSWKWPVFMFAYMTALAYLFAVGIHQLGRALGQT